MTRGLKTALLVLLLAALPIRALASVTICFCAFAHDHAGAVHHGSGGDHDSHDHGASPCSSCVEHCSSAAFAPCAPPALFAAPATTERSVLHERSVAGFIADHLDPPPLAG